MQPESPALSSERTGILLGLLAMLLFNICDGFWKYALAHTTLPVVLGLCFTVSAAMLAVYARLRKISLRPQNTRNVTIFTALYLLEQVTFVYALGRMPLAELFVIALTTPLFVLIGAGFLLRERLSLLQTASVFAGFAGTIIVVLSRVTHQGPVPHSFPARDIAVLAALVNVAFGGSKILFMRRYCRDENPVAMNFVMALVFAATGALFSGRALAHVSMSVGAALSAAGILIAISLLFYTKAAQQARAPLMSATQYSQIIWASLLGVIVFKEPLSGAAIAGAVLIILSGFFLYGPLLRGRQNMTAA